MPTRDYDHILKLLDDPWKWRIVSTVFRPDLHPVQNREHCCWRRENSHAHPFQEILVPLQGECLYGFNGHSYPCGPGVIFFFNCNEQHDFYYPVFTSGVIHLWFSFSQGITMTRIIHVKDGASARTRPSALISGNQTSKTMLDFWSQAAQDRKAKSSRKRIKLIMGIGAMLLAAHKNFVDSEDLDPAQHHLNAVMMVRKHLDATCGSGDSLDSLAHLAGFSKYHFLRIFKAHTGASIHAYINRKRMQKVKDMLRRGRLKKEIAAELGFSSPISFSRWFKDNFH